MFIWFYNPPMWEKIYITEKSTEKSQRKKGMSFFSFAYFFDLYEVLSSNDRHWSGRCNKKNFCCLVVSLFVSFFVFYVASLFFW